MPAQRCFPSWHRHAASAGRHDRGGGRLWPGMVFRPTQWGDNQIRRWRAQPEDRPRGWRGIVWRVVLPLVLNLAHGFAFLVRLPAMFGATLAYLCLYVPDFGYTLIVSGSLALVWGVVRTTFVWRLVRNRPTTSAVAVLKQA